MASFEECPDCVNSEGTFQGGRRIICDRCGWSVFTKVDHLRDLLRRSLEAITSPECISVFAMSANHGVVYKGPVVPTDEIRTALGMEKEGV